MTLTSFEKRWTATIARSLVPADALGGSLASIDIAQRYADETATSPWHAALLFRACLWLIWLAPFPRTFGGLDDAGRVATLERLLKHRVYPIRMASMMFKIAICSLLLGDESTLRKIGAYKLDVVDENQLVRRKEAS